jgi:hypothetical protein
MGGSWSQRRGPSGEPHGLCMRPWCHGKFIGLHYRELHSLRTHAHVMAARQERGGLGCRNLACNQNVGCKEKVPERTRCLFNPFSH